MDWEGREGGEMESGLCSERQREFESEFRGQEKLHTWKQTSVKVIGNKKECGRPLKEKNASPRLGQIRGYRLKQAKLMLPNDFIIMLLFISLNLDLESVKYLSAVTQN